MTSKKTTTKPSKPAAAKKPIDKSADLASSVMSSIETEQVKMHSKLYFGILSAVSIGSIFITSVMAAVFINLTARDVNYARSGRFTEFGPSARDEFLGAFPWALLVLALVALISTIVLLRKFDFSYRYRQPVIVGAVIGLVVALGVGFSVIGLSNRIEDTPFKGLQTLRERVESKIVSGEIVELNDDGFAIIDHHGDKLQIRVTDRTYNKASSSYEVGQRVGVFGERTGDTVDANGIGPEPRAGFKPPRVKGLKSPPEAGHFEKR